MHWRARALTTFDSEQSADADIMEFVLVQAEPYVVASSLTGKIFLKSRPAWSEADSGMLCSTKNDAKGNSERVTSTSKRIQMLLCSAVQYEIVMTVASRADITMAQITEN